MEQDRLELIAKVAVDLLFELDSEAANELLESMELTDDEYAFFGVINHPID